MASFAFVLPVKKAVRQAEGLAAGDRVPVQLRMVGFGRWRTGRR